MLWPIVGSKLQIRSVLLTYIESIYVIYSPNPMFDNLLESSLQDKLSNIGFDEATAILEFKIFSLSDVVL